MITRTLFLGFLMNIANLLSSQGESNFWQFGNYSGLDFNQVPPLLITSPLQATEGCSSMSDAQGNLLFYTNGITVYDKNDNVMQNGFDLMGNQSTTQSAVIIKKPESENLFYIFTLDCWENYFQNGFRYSIVDMNLNNGNGAVTIKNQLIENNIVEKLCLIKKCFSNDYWVIVHEFNSDNFIIYSLSANGINYSHTISIGEVHGPAYDYGTGYIAASNDGSKIAVSIKNKLLVELFDFDNENGIISNSKVIEFNNQFTYGVQFSPNNQLLYISLSNPFELVQFDISSNNVETILTTQISIGSCTSCGNGSIYTGALQTAPDGKIYVANRDYNYLGVIHNPNTSGLACNYDSDYIYLESLSSAGLPYFPADFFSQASDIAINLENTSDCPDQAALQITNFSDFDQIYYNINNGNTYYLTPTDQVINYSFLQEGNYNFNITAIKNCILQNTMVSINYTIPTPIDSTYYWCAGEPLLIDNVVYYTDTIINTSMLDNNDCSYPLNLTINFLPEPIINTELECVSPTLYNAFINIENGSNYYISSNYEGFPSGWIDNNFYLMDINTMDTIHYSITPIGDGACAYSYAINPLICTSALAISCYHLIGQPTKTGNLLAWQCDALNPLDSESINLMKSEDGKSFTLLKKYSFGTSFTDSHFEYLDANPAEHSYYQLWIESAELHKSNIIFIDKNNSQTEDSYISPMWINGHQLFSYVPEQFTSYRLFSIDGSLITNGIIDNNNQTLLLDFNGLPSGLYLVHLDDGLSGYTHKISYARY